MALRFVGRTQTVLVKQAHGSAQIAPGSSALHSFSQALSVPKIWDIKPGPWHDKCVSGIDPGL